MHNSPNISENKGVKDELNSKIKKKSEFQRGLLKPNYLKRVELRLEPFKELKTAK